MEALKRLLVRYADFRIDDGEVEAIKEELLRVPSLDRTYDVNIADRDGVVHAMVEKTIYIRRRAAAA